MLTASNVADLLGTTTVVLRDRDRRFGYVSEEIVQTVNGRRTGGYTPREVLLLAIAEVLMADGHSGFEARRMAYWMHGQIAIHLGLNDKLTFLHIFTISTGVWVDGDGQNVAKKYAAFVKGDNPLISDYLDIVDHFDESSDQVLVFNLASFAKRMPQNIVDALTPFANRDGETELPA